MTSKLEQSLRNAVVPLITKLQIEGGKLDRNNLDDLMATVVDTFKSQTKFWQEQEKQKWLWFIKMASILPGGNNE